MTVARLLDADGFAGLLGARLVEVAPARVVVEMQVESHHRDGTGSVSAGALFSLADCAMSLISNAEEVAVAIATHFTAGGRVDGPTVTAVARPELSDGDDGLTTWIITLNADGITVASFTGTTLRRGS